MIKKYHENVWYGTLKELVDELWTVIDFEHMEMPKVNFAASVMENADTAYEAYANASGWFGFKDVGYDFDCDRIALIFAHYGGGGIQSMELSGIEEEKTELIEKISASTDDVGYGIMSPNDYTVFEID